MKKKPGWVVYLLVAIFLCFNGVFVYSMCTNDIPKVIRSLPDWDIIASNVATFSVAKAFSGSNLVYSLSCTPDARNIVTIDPKTGEIHIKARVRDQFDITVTAKNACGSASTNLNVEIDEEY